MIIRVRLFAHMAAHAGLPELSLELPDHSPLSAVQTMLQQKIIRLPWPPGTLLAVNQEYATPDHLLQDHDEVAIIPPVSGGQENIP